MLIICFTARQEKHFPQPLPHRTLMLRNALTRLASTGCLFLALASTGASAQDNWAYCRVGHEPKGKSGSDYKSYLYTDFFQVWQRQGWDIPIIPVLRAKASEVIGPNRHIIDDIKCFGLWDRNTAESQRSKWIANQRQSIADFRKHGVVEPLHWRWVDDASPAHGGRPSGQALQFAYCYGVQNNSNIYTTRVFAISDRLDPSNLPNDFERYLKSRSSGGFQIKCQVHADPQSLEQARRNIDRFARNNGVSLHDIAWPSAH